MFELKPAYRLEGGFTADREDKFVYLASDDGCIRDFYNGHVKNIYYLMPNDFILLDNQ
jgi:hypothetical protein